MSIDISQFHETFLEEATENLRDLESGLLDLEEDAENADMNAIFRAAHSIKGGASTFGFDEIAEFTHVVESVLQKARDGELTISTSISTELLKGVDILSAMIDAARQGEESSGTGKEDCLAALNTYLDGDASPPPSAADTAPPPASEPQETASIGDDDSQMLAISFKPKANLPKTGSDPINIFRELATLGELSVRANIDAVPPLQELPPDELYITWELELMTGAKEDEILDVFLFVEDEAEINISVIAGMESAEKQAAAKAKAEAEEANKPEATAQPAEQDDDRRTGKDRRQAPERRAEPPKESQYIRVAIDKVDSLINMVGELVTTNAMVEQHSSLLNREQHQNLATNIDEMSRHTRNLQEGIMAIRMMPIEFAFSRFPRMVRDTSQKLGKRVRLITSGDQTELDKTVIERITDPLTHLVRNSVDHGLEMPEERITAGKPEEGTVELKAFYRGGNVIIEISDDGRGMDRERILQKAKENSLITGDENFTDQEVWQFIFESGFSTAKEVTDVSGRGVGMDVVRKNIKALGGSIKIKSERGVGTTMSISLPLTLAIVDGMAVRGGDETYIIPLLNILESVRPTEDSIRSVQDGVEVIDIRGDYLPLLRLAQTFEVEFGKSSCTLEEGIAIVVEADQKRIAIFVDDLLGVRQVVIKSLENNYKQVEGISGATILGDGKVAFILDLPGLIRMAGNQGQYKRPAQHRTGRPAQRGYAAQEAALSHVKEINQNEADDLDDAEHPTLSSSPSASQPKTQQQEV